MPRYKFRWPNLPDKLLDDLGQGLFDDCKGFDPAEVLQGHTSSELRAIDRDPSEFGRYRDRITAFRQCAQCGVDADGFAALQA